MVARYLRRRGPQQEQEWLRQLNLIYSAASLDLTAKICVIAFSVAIPLLAALVVINRQEVFRGRATPSVLASTARVVAQASAFTGVVAGFWHILWIAGVGMLAGGVVGVGVHSAGWWRLEQDRLEPPKDGEEPGDTEP
jgi:hypothetical protein